MIIAFYILLGITVLLMIAAFILMIDCWRQEKKLHKAMGNLLKTLREAIDKEDEK